MGKVVEFEPNEEQFGIFWKYISESDITGINYNGKELWLTDLKRGRYKADEEVPEKFLEQFVNVIANCANKQFNDANPLLEADTKDLRISILHPSVAKSGLSISLRKSPPMVRSTIDGMIQSGYCSKKIMELLLNCVTAKMNFVFGGEPGAGKTELAKFFMQFIPPEQRVITIEDSLELHYKEINMGCDGVELQVRDDFDYRAAIKASLRQDPDWLMLSEARSLEVTELLESWSTGICGFTTLHLDDLRKLPDRILSMMDEKDAGRMVNRIYADVGVGVLVRMRKGKGGNIERFIDQLGFYDREEEENQIYMLVENGVQISEELPEEIKRKFSRAGIRNPFYCERMEEYIACGK